jgi:hypothetical protein
MQRDPVIDEVGHDPRSVYEETLCLPVRGPTTITHVQYGPKRSLSQVRIPSA